MGRCLRGCLRGSRDYLTLEITPDAETYAQPVVGAPDLNAQKKKIYRAGFEPGNNGLAGLEPGTSILIHARYMATQLTLEESSRAEIWT